MANYLTFALFDTQRLIRKSSWTIYHRGQSYYHWNRVKLLHIEDTAALMKVRGTRDYRVKITLREEGNDFNAFCTCPQGQKGNFCKHQVAAGLFLSDYLRKHGKGRWKRLLNAVVTLPKPRKSKQSPYLLFFDLNDDDGYWSLIPTRLWARDFPAEIPQKDDPAFLTTIQNAFHTDELLSAKLKQPRSSLPLDTCVNCSDDVVSLANAIIRERHNQSRYYYYSPHSEPDIGGYLKVLKKYHAPIFIDYGLEARKKLLAILPELGDLFIKMVENEAGDMFLQPLLEVGDLAFRLENGGFDLVSQSPPWVLVNDTYLFQFSSAYHPDLPSHLAELSGSKIAADEKDLFIEDYLMPLMQQVRVQHDSLRWLDIEDEEPVKRLYLMEEAGELLVSLRFGYGAYEAKYDKKEQMVSLLRDEEDPWLFVRVHRQREIEDEVQGTISSARNGLKRSGSEYGDDIFLLRARIDPVDFLLRKVPILLKEGFEIYGEDELKNVRVNRHHPTISLNVTSGIDWFDVKTVIKFGDIPVPLKEIRQTLRRKERFVKLADGSIGEIPEEWIKKYRHLFRLGEETDEGVRLADFHLTLIDELLLEADNAQVDDAFKERLQRLKNFQGVEEKPIPTGFQGQLRDYQKSGYDWLHFLHDYGFGGILADDMGLGKTVQVLVLLLSLRESGEARAADLIVVPRSLLVNWERESERFTPALRVHQHFGPGRRKDTSLFDDYDIVLTTYGTMRQDIALLRDYRFHYVVLDESQAIKNPLSQTAKAARLLKTENRLAMTGTPVENNAFELWSQFAFVNPGLLGGLEYFKQDFATPIEKKGDEAAAEFLRKMVYPFILRRTKAQVATELPPRTEKILYCDMEPAQRRFYNKTRDQYRAMLLGIVEEKGMNQARMKVLEGLLRLRQISNHPKLMNPKFRGGSAKMEMLLQEMTMLREGGHKALIFSQFVKMLKLVQAELDRQKIPYVYLDGRTRKRQERVDLFQSDPNIPFFLISLKAGGVGLNLTAADFVIHIDPWWNPAVEMQATDRTHRIGQDKPVFVYKLIARNSVEEKILQLQERKRALVSQLISTESSVFKSLNAEDIAVLFS